MPGTRLNAAKQKKVLTAYVVVYRGSKVFITIITFCDFLFNCALSEWMVCF